MDFGKYLTGEVVRPKGFGARYESPMRDFRETGKLPTANQADCPANLVPASPGAEMLTRMTPTPRKTRRLTSGRQCQPAAAAAAMSEITKLSDDQVSQIITQARLVPSLRSIVDEAQLTDPHPVGPQKRRTGIRQRAPPGARLLCREESQGAHLG